MDGFFVVPFGTWKTYLLVMLSAVVFTLVALLLAPLVPPFKPFVHLVSSETNDNQIPDRGNILASGSLVAAVHCLPLYTRNEMTNHCVWISVHSTWTTIAITIIFWDNIMLLTITTAVKSPLLLGVQLMRYKLFCEGHSGGGFCVPPPLFFIVHVLTTILP